MSNVVQVLSEAPPNARGKKIPSSRGTEYQRSASKPPLPRLPKKCLKPEIKDPVSVATGGVHSLPPKNSFSHAACDSKKSVTSEYIQQENKTQLESSSKIKEAFLMFSKKRSENDECWSAFLQNDVHWHSRSHIELLHDDKEKDLKLLSSKTNNKKEKRKLELRAKELVAEFCRAEPYDLEALGFDDCQDNWLVDFQSEKESQDILVAQVEVYNLDQMFETEDPFDPEHNSLVDTFDHLWWKVFLEDPTWTDTELLDDVDIDSMLVA